MNEIINSQQEQGFSGPLTITGMGRIVSASAFNSIQLMAAKDIASVVSQYGVLVVRGLENFEEEFRDFIARLGTPVRYSGKKSSVGYGFGDILKLDGTFDKKKIATGRGPLPLHSDGVILGTEIDLVVLYCVERSDDENSATIVCDQKAAIAEMPSYMIDLLVKNGVEYLALEKEYYTSVVDDWFSVEAIRDYGKGIALSVAFPFPKGVPASWQVRIIGLSEQDSDRYFWDLNEFLNNQRYTYMHRWKTGDLMIIDNRYTLHGRQSINGHSVRQILRGQVVLN